MPAGSCPSQQQAAEAAGSPVTPAMECTGGRGQGNWAAFTCSWQATGSRQLTRQGCGGVPEARASKKAAFLCTAEVGNSTVPAALKLCPGGTFGLPDPLQRSCLTCRAGPGGLARSALSHAACAAAWVLSTLPEAVSSDWQRLKEYESCLVAGPQCSAACACRHEQAPAQLQATVLSSITQPLGFVMTSSCPGMAAQALGGDTASAPLSPASLLSLASPSPLCSATLLSRACR